MIQKFYMGWESIWFWTPYYGWRRGNVISCGRNRITLRHCVGEEGYRIYHTTPCRVRPRDRNSHSPMPPTQSPFEFEECQ